MLLLFLIFVKGYLMALLCFFLDVSNNMLVPDPFINNISESFADSCGDRYHDYANECYDNQSDDYFHFTVTAIHFSLDLCGTGLKHKSIL